MMTAVVLIVQEDGYLAFYFHYIHLLHFNKDKITTGPLPDYKNEKEVKGEIIVLHKGLTKGGYFGGRWRYKRM